MTDNSMQEFVDSYSLAGNFPALRERLQEKGYLFFRNFLDKTALLRIRNDVLELAAEYGFVKEGTEIIDGIFSGKEFPKSFETSHLYRKILELPSFNAFGRNPEITQLYAGLLEGEPLEHRRRIGRITFPQSFHNTTPAHQDFFYIRGSRETYTNWIPNGDCPRELGGLAVLEGSNHLDFLKHVQMSGTGGFGISDEDCNATGLSWLTTNFQIGDLLLFHSLTIHKALHNTTQNKLRLSLEYRIQRNNDSIDPSSEEYHMKGSFGGNELV